MKFQQEMDETGQNSNMENREDGCEFKCKSCNLSEKAMRREAIWLTRLTSPAAYETLRELRRLTRRTDERVPLWGAFRLD
ncbi:unnamed protein product, partial [Iphiclides podalirius]